MRLRPDPFEKSSSDSDLDPTELARSQEYGLLATLLSRAPNAALLESLADLRGDPTPLGLAHATLGERASNTSVAKVEREYFQLFIGLGRGDLLPYASYYLTGFLNERPLSRLRADLAELGIERVDNNYEPEDHAATLCEIMSGLACGRFAAPPAAQRDLFKRHLAPWIFRLFVDMENLEDAPFYRAVGNLGRVFMEIEAEAFTLAD
jgi:TorA maturation chaperone TorD